MALIKASGLALSAADALLPAGVPLIGSDNVVEFGNVSATSEQTSYPVTNIVNPATNLEWRAAANSPPGTATIAITTASADPIDYIAVAGHNLGSAGVSVQVTSNVGTLIPSTLIVDDAPIVFQFSPQVLSTISLVLTAGSEVSRIAVVYVGKLLLCERGVEVDNDLVTPFFSRKTDVVSARSARGDYLGTVVLSRYLADATIIFKHFTPTWFRNNFEPFIRIAQAHHPFFFVWNPNRYPLETAFVWLRDDPVRPISPVTDRVNVTLQVDGIVE